MNNSLFSPEVSLRDSYVYKQASSAQAPVDQVNRLMVCREAGFEAAMHHLFGVTPGAMPMAKQAYALQLHRQMDNVHALAAVAKAAFGW